MRPRALATALGAVFTDAHQDHGTTETAPGHASVMSGRFPSHTGIVRNNPGVQDPPAPLVGAKGDAVSPFRFRGSVLTHWLRAADPRTRALGVSRKDRGAILPLGRAHQSVFWYAYDGTFTTSTYYADTLRAWVRQFNARGGGAARRFAGQAWDLLLAPSAYPEPDSAPLESGGRAFTFPHVIPADPAGASTGATSSPRSPARTSTRAAGCPSSPRRTGSSRAPWTSRRRSPRCWASRPRSRWTGSSDGRP